MTPKTLRAALYARFSTTKQSENSIPDQMRVCEHICAREGFKVVAKFSDAAVSGGTANREGYRNLLLAAKAHQFDVVVAEDSSRLWRELAEQWRALKELLDLKIHVVGHGIDTRREESKLLLSVTGAAAEAYRDEIARRTRRGLDGLARAGKNAGGRSYGYACINKVRTIDPKQAKVVLQIYQWRAAGWSAQRIARQLNEDGVPSPGSTWARINTGPRRKTQKGWRPSAIAGDPERGVGILNNPTYKGQVIWGRSKWVRGAADSEKRTVEQVDPSQWVITEHPELRIVPEKLWNAVHAIQTARNGKRDAVRRGVVKGRRGIQKYVGGSDSRYWLGGGVLVCAECGSNLIGDGRTDYVCPAHTSNNCKNDMRFRREDAHLAVFDLMREELLSDKQIALGQKYAEQVLRERAKEEDQATQDAASGVDVKRLDEEIKQLRNMPLRPAALAAAIAEIEKERDGLLAKATGKREMRDNRARKLLARMPEIVRAYRQQLQQAMKVIADPRLVHDARETTRRLLVDGQIALAPTKDHKGVTGPVRLVNLGDHVLQLAGWQRTKAVSQIGSGGRIP